MQTKVSAGMHARPAVEVRLHAVTISFHITHVTRDRFSLSLFSLSLSLTYTHTHTKFELVEVPATRGEVSLSTCIWRPAQAAAKKSALPAVVIVHQVCERKGERARKASRWECNYRKREKHRVSE
jgi:hypothetical protein